MKKLVALLICLVGTSAQADDVTEFWNAYDARKEPLNVEIVQEWDEGNVKTLLIRYDLGRLVGSNKTASPKIAGYYSYPKNGVKIPGLVQIHGGGQRANKANAQFMATMGYGCISINWGGRVLEQPNSPNTDWDGLAAGFIRPGVTRDDQLDHHNVVAGGPNTLHKEPHVLNSSWSLIAMSARRALTFLEHRNEIDANKLGVYGHSMGGRSTVLTAIDPRLKAVSPSVGGSGFLYEDLWGLPNSKRRMVAADAPELYARMVSCQSYWPHIKAPMLFLQASNDFNAPMDFVAKGLDLLPKETDSRLTIAPHFNHRFDTGTANARILWFEDKLKGNFKFPQQPKAKLTIEGERTIPRIAVTPDPNSKFKIKKVAIYYGYARDPRIRFWRTAKHKLLGDAYHAHLHVFDTGEPLFAFANVTYEIDRSVPARAGVPASKLLTLSSNYIAVYPEELKSKGVDVSSVPIRLIDDFVDGWQDWYLLSANNPEHWYYGTRKLVDPAHVGPLNGKLAVEMIGPAGGRMAVGIHVNEWVSYTGRRRDTFVAEKTLVQEGSQKILLQLSDFKNTKGESLKDWDETTELFFTPASKRDPKAEKWTGKPPRLTRLYWEGGTYIERPHPHQPRGDSSKAKVIQFEDEFKKAIDDSVELEKLDEDRDNN